MSEAGGEDGTRDETTVDVVGDEEAPEGETLRRSERESVPTERMASYLADQKEKRERATQSALVAWRGCAKNIRKELLEDCTEEELGSMLKEIQWYGTRVVKSYEELRTTGTVSTEIVRKVDATAAVTSDMTTIINERLSGVEDYTREGAIAKAKGLKEHSYAASIFSSLSPSEVAEAAADLAEKEAEFEHVKEERIRKERLAKLEYEHKLVLHNLKELEKKKEIAMAKARLSALEPELSGNHGDTPPPVKDQPPDPNSNAMDTLAEAIAKSMNLGRLPVPEPTVFLGDPLAYVEWKTSFNTLIEQKAIPPGEKIFYLKRYTGGPARKALEGFFYSNGEEAYVNARKVLDERYGHPFVVQKAFRSKLDKWPKIGPADSEGLRNLADFLQGCRDAIRHVPSLKILSDSAENQKILYKLPDWLSARWNRDVTTHLEKTKCYPDFDQFVEFMKKEAKVACNPVSSLFALRETDRKPGSGGSRVKVLATNSQTTKSGNEHTNSNLKMTKPCDYCGGEHYIYKCNGFLALTLTQKRDHVRKNRLCYGCLNKGHVNKECKRKHTCAQCKRHHPTCLHEDRAPTQQQPSGQGGGPSNQQSSNCQQSNGQQQSGQAIGSFCVTQREISSTSMIVPVWVSSASNPTSEILTYALLDTQSDTTFLLEETATALHANTIPVQLSLSTMTSQNAKISSKRVENLKVRRYDSTEYVAINHAYTREFIPVDRAHIPQRDTVKGWPHLAPVLDRLPPLQSCDVGLLIEYNCPQALAPRQILTGNAEEPYAVETVLGWSVVGFASPLGNIENPGSVSLRTAVREQPICLPRDAVKALEGEFAIQSTEGGQVSQDDICFLNKMDKEISKRDDKHLEMPLPFKERPNMPNNKPLALLRLGHLKRKLKNDKNYYEQYKNYMSEIIEREDAELVETKGVPGNKWYIPHHGVYHAKKPDKLRVVYDCSARYKGASLNDHLLTGPDLTNKLVGVLCRFRRYPVAIMCDIEKMFHQFVVRESDRDFLRFLWWENGNLESEPLEFRMTKHLFGAASSPGCANYGLKHLATTQETNLPKAAAFVKNDFYVDDGLASLEDEQEAIYLVKDAQELCSSGGLRLHKFISNSKTVIESIPVSERAADVKDLDLSLEPLPVERALGIKWCIENDIFSFQATIKNPIATRRNMLSIVASIFDPIGFLSPFTLTGKRILQQMCQNGVGWDDPLPKGVQPGWESWINDIHNLQFVKIPRSLKPADIGKPTVTELHHFSDASTSGYGQVSYIRYVNEGKVHCSMLMAKARVAPQKIVTIPRLELTAATLSVKMSQFLKEELGLNIDKEYFWTDSRVVLGYINNDARRFHVFVANRVQMIRDATQPNQWFYVKTENNPADHASRGLTASEIVSSTWLKGPSFLWQDEIETNQVDAQLQLGDPEVRTVRSMCTKTASFPSLPERFNRFSSWSTLVSVIARLQRLSNGVKGTHPPTVEERLAAERKILTLVQHDTFSETIGVLKNSLTLPKTNALYSLDPILQNGLLCVGGRLRKADLSPQHQHPVILPKDNHVTKLILGHAHEKVWHQGRGITLNRLRSGGYWIIGGSKTVASMIRQCVVCRKLRRPTETQRMADLPDERVVQSPPFTFCGMDCFGPFTVKLGRREVKRYGLLFTCMCTRAIHVEMLDDMSTDAFINGLRCFIAIRGAVRQIRSDQGTNFVGAKNEFEKETNMNKVKTVLAEKQCELVMNTPCASHTGGVWERQIKSVRSILDSILLLCPGRLDDASLRTIFYEIMSIVNSRPLAVSEIDDPDGLEPLTPNHILTAKADIPHPPPGVFVKQDLLLQKRWRRVQYLLEQFWSRWKKEYVNQIALRQKWLQPRRNMRVGDVVLVKDVNLPRNQWPLAKVVEVTEADDGLVRTVKVKMGSRGSPSACSILERSVHKLVLLLEQ